VSGLLTLAALCSMAAPARAVTIFFEVTDLPDALPGEDLYRYEYSLSDFLFPAGYGFSILFDHALYTSLESPPPTVGPDWDILSIQPDPGLPDDGLFDALALVDAPPTLSGFAIEFVWLGTGIPGSQPFQIYDSAFETIESGQTQIRTVAVPEPRALGLLVLTLIAPFLCARRRVE
jgi:hypothetical protein